ncbi:MAG TPA: hypothetical protein VF652_00540 [Allosphingosinicella sp.]
MRLAFLALALALPAASLALPAAAPQRGPAANRLAQSAIPSRICGNPLKVRPVGTPGSAKARPLGELPPGELTLTVVNMVGDCIEPVIVRQGYGDLSSGPGR